MPKQKKRPEAAGQKSSRSRAKPNTAVAEEHVRGLLAFLGEDVGREGLLETPARVVRAMSEHFSGYGQDAGGVPG